MKVFMVTDFFWPGIGGLENSTAYLTKALQTHFSVEILTLASTTPLTDDAPPLPIRRFSTDKGAPYEAMEEYIASYTSPKAVCFFGFSDEWTDRHLDFVVHARQNLAEKVTFKIPSLHEFSFYINSLERKEKILAVDHFICTNHGILEELIQRGIPEEKIVFQPNGVPCDTFVPGSFVQKRIMRKRLGLNDNLVFIFTGRFAARKRVNMLVEAFQNIPDANLVLVGYFDNRFDEGSAFEVPKNGHIHIFGPVYNVLPYLHAAEIFVSASLAEGMPNAMLESLSCGLPALVTAIPGHQEVIRAGKNGQFFDPNSIEDLCAHIRWFIRHRDELPVLSVSARETALFRFNIESVADTYRRILGEAG